MSMERDYLENLLKDKDIIYLRSFFESLKSTSLLDFRKNMNTIGRIHLGKVESL